MPAAVLLSRYLKPTSLDIHNARICQAGGKGLRFLQINVVMQAEEALDEIVQSEKQKAIVKNPVPAVRAEM